MRERNLSGQIDLYFRREDTVLAKSLKVISPNEGACYRKSALKQGLEKSIAIPAAVSTLPIQAALATAINLEDGGATFYKQERLNQEGTFNIVKFRTMREGQGESSNVNLQQAATNKPDQDPRNTRVGRFMRKFELEELPQLWQVAVGTMSLVGIRAAPYYVINHLKKEQPDFFENWQQAYKEGKPGLVSLNAAMNNKRKDDLKRHRYDALYAEKASLGLDLYILYKVSVRGLQKVINSIMK